MESGSTDNGAGPEPQVYPSALCGTAGPCRITSTHVEPPWLAMDGHVAFAFTGAAFMTGRNLFDHTLMVFLNRDGTATLDK
ncbi:hypothetical protein N7454_008503 [Penicillium verhagenii]|nr:hypothetical protein N7454_008503 [Penicillium verhagenii]